MRDGSNLYHTYSAYTRGFDILINTYNYLDLTPMGRNESSPLERVRHHDRYQDGSQNSTAVAVRKNAACKNMK
ncbi:DUF899 family protein [Paenibacillus sp. sptzw28]|nr:DUF899 family protein [Paenibacillus sp. sptzw28]